MIKKIALITAVTLTLIVVYNLLVQITDAIKSKDRLSKQAESVTTLETQNKELKKRLSEIESPEFIETQARDKLGLGKSGETVVIIPEDKLKSVLEASSSSAQSRLPNWQGWLKVFFH